MAQRGGAPGGVSIRRRPTKTAGDQLFERLVILRRRQVRIIQAQTAPRRTAADWIPGRPGTPLHRARAGLRLRGTVVTSNLPQFWSVSYLYYSTPVTDFNDPTSHGSPNVIKPARTVTPHPVATPLTRPLPLSTLLGLPPKQTLSPDPGPKPSVPRHRAGRGARRG
jgi:hypothetical protein